MRKALAAAVILSTSLSSLYALDYTSATSGNWNDIATWNPTGNPQTGSTDDVFIGIGHAVIYTGASVGLPNSGDLGTSAGHTITLDGGILTQSVTGNWVRIGQNNTGFMNINDGAFYFTNNGGGTSTQSPNLQIGLEGGAGVINIGDGIGAAGTAILDLQHLVNGADNVIAVNMNLASSAGNGISGVINIQSDGVLIGDRRIIGAGANSPVIRIGQTPSATQSAINITGGGAFHAHGTVELGSNNPGSGNRSNGLISISGAGSVMDMDAGELNIGWNGDGAMLIDNNGVFSKTNTPGDRLDILIGREATGVGTVTVQNGGQFLRGAGSDVGDMRIGLRGTGTMIINDGGLVQNDTGNWDWIGQDNGGNGTLTINSGGTFRTTQGSNFNVGINTGATGLVTVNGGTLDLQNAGAAQIRLGQNGNATFRQVSGTTNASSMQMAENNGTALFDLQGGTISLRAQFFMGGAAANSTGTGIATGTQSGGTFNIAGSLVVGLATGHSASYTMTNGLLNHTGGDTSIGESGSGVMTIGADGMFNDTSAGGSFFVGRNDGSSGTLYVDGRLDRTAATAIRVGNGNPNGVDNTTGTGILGGTGVIMAQAGGVRVGVHGAITGGTTSTVGTLSLTGDLSFSTGGTLLANIGQLGNSDQLSITGGVDITGATLGGTWAGGLIGPANPYWLVVNDGGDLITGVFGNTSPTSPNSFFYPDADAWITIDGQEFGVFYDADFDTNSFTGGNDLAIAAVPEPSSIVALLGGLGALVGLTRRRRG